MSDVQYFIDDVKRALAAAPDQRLFNKGSMRDRMKYMKQEELIESFTRMNLKELQYCMGCGIPGTANTEAIRYIKIRRSEFDKFLEMQSKREMQKVEEKPAPDIAGLETTTEANNPEGIENEEVTEGPRKSKATDAFESGRESDL